MKVVELGSMSFGEIFIGVGFHNNRGNSRGLIGRQPLSIRL